MNIAIIAIHDITGGAARAMYRLHQGFGVIDENSYIISKIKKSDDPKVIHANPIFEPSKNPDIEKEKWIQTEYIDKGRSVLSNTLFTFAYPGYDLSQIEAIRKADIINLHWVAWFQSAETISKLLSLGKPVVWTLHDMRAFTGGCHYSAGCDKFTIDCSNCPQIQNDHLNIASKVLELQKISYGNGKLTVVTPSSWLANEAKRSAIFCDNKIKTIPNGLDLETFSPIDKKKAREKLGLDPNKKYLLFGADGTGSTYKGFDLLIEALKKIKICDIVLLMFGNEHDDVKKLAIPCVSYSKIDDDNKLAIIYSAADIFLLPSREDNLPNVMLESIACGTPVISFESGGAVDVIKDGFSGHLIPPYNTDIFASKIEEALEDATVLHKMSQFCSEFAKQNFSLEKQAKAYKMLFAELCDGSAPNSHYCFYNNTTANVDRLGVLDSVFK